MSRICTSREIDPVLGWSPMEVFDATIDLEPGTKNYERVVRVAQVLCRRCPALTECLADAANVPAGVVAGMTADERHKRGAAA